jgi:hypothetical protein
MDTSRTLGVCEYPFLSYGTSVDGNRSFLILSLEPPIGALLKVVFGKVVLYCTVYSSNGRSCSDIDLESFMGGY